MRPPANVKQGSPINTLVEFLYREFVGKSDDHVAMAKEAFYKAQMCDFNFVHDFVHYYKNLLYTTRLYHSAKAKIAFIHKLPRGGLNQLLPG